MEHQLTIGKEPLLSLHSSFCLFFIICILSAPIVIVVANLRTRLTILNTSTVSFSQPRPFSYEQTTVPFFLVRRSNTCIKHKRVWSVVAWITTKTLPLTAYSSSLPRICHPACYQGGRCAALQYLFSSRSL